MGKKEKAKDATKYGEFISTFHHWMSAEKQKEIAGHLEKATKPEDEK